MQETLAQAIVGFGIGRSGRGRRIFNSPPQSRLLVNGGFSFDTDSLLDGIARFLGQKNKCPHPVYPSDETNRVMPKLSRSEFFRTPGALSTIDGTGDTLIVINGMERFFGTQGQILSAELDELLRLAATNTDVKPVQWLLFGTERVRAYMEDMRADTIDFRKLLQFDPNRKCTSPSWYLSSVEDAFSKTNPETNLAEQQPALARKLADARTAYFAQWQAQMSGDINNYRRAFFEAYLDRAVLEPKFIPLGNYDLAVEVLRILAFTGLPTEIDPILASLRIRDTAKRLVQSAEHADRAALGKSVEAALDTLFSLKLVIKIEGFQRSFDKTPAYNPDIRYALHRNLLTEFRYRFGIPLSEAKLSTAFNMSLYVAQPIDGYIPEPDIHDELGSLIDRLIGSHKDELDEKLPGDPDLRDEKVESALAAALEKVSPGKDKKNQDELRRIHRLCHARSVCSLRAALAVARGYYSTTGLLTLNSGDRLIREDRDGILLEHADR